MKHPKKGVLDTVIYNTDITVTNIPNKVYNYIVNGKPAIEWIIDQYNVSIDKKSGILDDPNEFSEDPNSFFKSAFISYYCKYENSWINR